MAVPDAEFGNKLYSLAMFLMVSVLSGLVLSGFVVPGAAMAGMTASEVSQALEELPQDLETPPLAQGSKLQFADGTPLAEIYENKREYRELKDIAPIMKEAQLAVEDKRFYEHGALDFTGTMRALVVSGGRQGGSTITQQVVKMSRIEAAMLRDNKAAMEKANERTVTRKIQELRYAIAMERKFSKDQILERYLNIAYFGDGAYGVEAAAQHFFNTSAKKLTLPQAAQLAGMVQNPSATDPTLHPKASITRRNLVLGLMLDQGKISKKDYEAAKKVPFDQKKVQPKRNGCTSSSFPKVCQFAVAELLQDKRLGKTGAERDKALKRSGYTITVTVDRKLQKLAEEKLVAKIPGEDPLIATMTAIKPGDGAVKVFAQNRRTFGTGAKGESNYMYALPDSYSEGYNGFASGSTFKIFASAAALQKGIPATRKISAPATLNMQSVPMKSCAGIHINKPFVVKNDTHSKPGTFDMYRAAQRSVNTWYMKLSGDIGTCPIIKMAEAAGVQLGATRPWNKPKQKILHGKIPRLDDAHWDTKQFTLGPVDAAPISLTNAYATFAARGKRCDYYVVQEIETRDGKKLGPTPHTCKQTIKQDVADTTNQVFKTVAMNPIGSGFSTLYPDGRDQAGKTGTTDGPSQALYAGYTPELAMSAMISVDQSQQPWKKVVEDLGTPSFANYVTTSGVRLQGYGAPDATRDLFTPVWHAALKDLPPTKFGKASDELLKGKWVSVPQVTFRNPDADESILRKAGFSVVREERDSRYPKGTYLGPSPSGGKLRSGSTVTLRFSKGPKIIDLRPKPSASAGPGDPGDGGDSGPTDPVPTQPGRPSLPGQPTEPPKEEN